jgi:HSP20 family protein
MNSFEDKDSYRFEFNLAGFDKNDIKVTINSQNILTIKGVKKQLSKQDKKNLLKQEQFCGSFSRSISLPSDIDKNKINLTYNNGVLKIVIQKDILHKDIRTLEIK